MNQSENINELVAALSKAQGEMEPAKFNRKGQRHKYADFTSVMHSCRVPLSTNNLAIMQYVETIDKQHVLITMLSHTSGQWIKSHLPLLMNEPTCQSLGSAMSYMKRYGLSALLGIVSDADEGADDDGESAMIRGKTYNDQQTPKQDIQGVIEKVGKAEIIALTTLIKNLDEESNKSFLDWINKNFNANSIQDIPKADFERCVGSLNAKIKYLNNRNREQQTMAVA